MAVIGLKFKIVRQVYKNSIYSFIKMGHDGRVIDRQTDSGHRQTDNRRRLSAAREIFVSFRKERRTSNTKQADSD